MIEKSLHSSLRPRAGSTGLGLGWRLWFLRGRGVLERVVQTAHRAGGGLCARTPSRPPPAPTSLNWAVAPLSLPSSP